MRRLSWPIVFLLVFAIVLQNTCPHGFAGKTTLARSCAHHCTSTTHHAPAKDGLTSASMSSHHRHEQPPLFVFSLPSANVVVHISPIETKVTLLDRDYKDAFPEEILKPPTRLIPVDTYISA